MFFYVLYFCCFTFRNAPNCSFRCFKCFDVIAFKKKSSLKFISSRCFYVLTRVSCAAPGCTLVNNNIRVSYNNNNVIITISRRFLNPGTCLR